MDHHGNMYVYPASVHVVSGDGTNRVCYIERMLGQHRTRLTSIEPASVWYILFTVEGTRLSQATHIAWSSAALTAIFPQLTV